MSLNQRKSVMLIDDSSMMLKAFEGMLSVLDVDILSYSNPREAIDSFSKRVPSIVITDLEMPELTGLEIIEKIRNQQAWKKIPIIVLTSHDEDKNIISCLQAGANDYLIKRSNPEVFLVKIQNFLELTKLHDMEKAQESMATYKATVVSLNHEFNNIISIVSLYLEQSVKKEIDDKLRENLDNSLRRLVQKIKDFRKIESIQVESYVGDTKMINTEKKEA